MFLNKFLLIGGGLTIAGTGTGLGVYYVVNSGQNQTENQKPLDLGNTDQNGMVSMPKGDDLVPQPSLRSQGS